MFNLPIEPLIHTPPLDPNYMPAAVFHRAFRSAVAASGGGKPVSLALERGQGSLSRYDLDVLPPDHPQAAANLYAAERVFKFLLWQWGGWKAYVAGDPGIFNHIRSLYAPGGQREFDYYFMGDEVYQKPFTVVASTIAELPAAHDPRLEVGRYTGGFRVGIDLGASDIKVSAIRDGEAIFSQEIIWEPRKHADPSYHYNQIWSAIALAAGKLPRVEAVGVSAAGIYIDNQAKVASLFRAVPKDQYGQVRSLFLRIEDRLGVPLVVVNDGEVTALAGSTWLEDAPVLGIAMGSNQAAGYVDEHGKLTTWLNELAFAPVDYQPQAPRDEWSHDTGTGTLYFSQQCVFRLLPRAGITPPQGVTDAEKLEFVQRRLEAGEDGAVQIWQTMGIYLGYSLAHYSDFYRLKHVLLLGRCTSGSGGRIMVEKAQQVLQDEFPELSRQVVLHLPDESSRRVGQSVTAGFLPNIEM